MNLRTIAVIIDQDVSKSCEKDWQASILTGLDDLGVGDNVVEGGRTVLFNEGQALLQRVG